MKTFTAIAIFAIATLLAACGSSASGKRATNANAAANAAVTSTTEVLDNKIKVTLEGEVVSPTEKDLFSAKSAAQQRKSKAESEARKREQAATADLFTAQRAEERRDLENFRASDIDGYYAYLEMKTNYDYEKSKNLEKTSIAYRAFKAKEDERTREYNAAKEKAELQEKLDSLLIEYVYAKELELIERKYSPKKPAP